MAKNIFILIVLLITCYVFFIEPNKLNVTHYDITNNALKGVRVVFVSDLHVKPKDQAKLKKVVDKINSLEPDLILSGGDYINGEKEEETMPIEKIAETLKMASLGHKFYTILGEHDLNFDKARIVKALTNNRIYVLSNMSRKLPVKNRYINIIGLEGESAGAREINKALSTVQGPVVVLAHSPIVFSEVPSKIGLILAGHTHGGQVVIPPFGPMMMPENYKVKNYVHGLFEDGNKKMIVTSGIGTSKKNIRFNCPPEIVVIDFK